MFKLFNEIPVGANFIADNGSGKPVTYVKGLYTIHEAWNRAEDYNAKQLNTSTLHQFESETKVIVV